MKETKRNEKDRGESLYRAIGQIDDRFVSEALEYRAEPKRARVLPLISALSSVAAALLVVTVALQLFMRAPVGEENPSDDEIPSAALWSVAADYADNRALLLCLSELEVAAESSAEAPILSEGAVRIIWRSATDGTYYTVPLDGLSKKDRTRLEALLASAPAADIPAGSENAPYSLWIDMGDGTAYSPYLPATDGTVSYGLPADYAPEHLPSEALAAFLEALLRASTD